MPACASPLFRTYSNPMKMPHCCAGLLFIGALVLVGSLSGCSRAWLRVQQVPQNGFAQTLNYQFQAQVHADSSGHCRMMTVQVKPLNKVYSSGEPPSRLQLFDDDCASPVRFERAQFVSKETGEHVRLSGSEVYRFLSNYTRLENELIGWLWRAGII